MKTDPSFDAVVVGAGPAGSIAAYEIARAGFSVLLVEKHPVVGRPVCCAEGITVEGLTQVVPLDRHWISTEISGAILCGPQGRRLEIIHPDAGYILDRTRFDRDLAERATAAGATLWVNTEARGLNSSDGELFDRVLLWRDNAECAVRCRIILGCDGVESLAGRWAGLDTTLAPDDLDTSAQYLLGGLTNVAPHKMEIHLSAELTPGGYAWIFPKNATTANVGLGFTPWLAGSRKAIHRLDEFVARRFPGAKILAKTGGAVPAFRGRKMMQAKNVLLAGDAARLLDSLTGAGIANALLSGQYAGQTAAEYLSRLKPDLALLRRYPERFMKRKGRELRYLRYARHIFLKMTERDFVEVMEFLRPIYHGKTIHAINGIAIIKSILRAKPRLLALARHLLW
jgi:digeranylgeranylglycerophospholipid reductase